jgi:hypothetical protein
MLTDRNDHSIVHSFYIHRAKNSQVLIKQMPIAHFRITTYQKAVAVTGLEWPRGFQEVSISIVGVPCGTRCSNMWLVFLIHPDYMTTARDGGKVVSLKHRPPLPPGNAPGTHFCQRLSRPQGHSAIGRIMSMNKFQ